jgi:hypothetical protein
MGNFGRARAIRVKGGKFRPETYVGSNTSAVHSFELRKPELSSEILGGFFNAGTALAGAAAVAGATALTGGAALVVAAGAASTAAAGGAGGAALAVASGAYSAATRSEAMCVIYGKIEKLAGQAWGFYENEPAILCKNGWWVATRAAANRDSYWIHCSFDERSRTKTLMSAVDNSIVIEVDM